MHVMKIRLFHAYQNDIIITFAVLMNAFIKKVDCHENQHMLIKTSIAFILFVGDVSSHLSIHGLL